MALANSSIQEANNMEKANSNPDMAFRSTANYELDHHQIMSQSVINFKCGIDNIFQKNNKNNESLLSFKPHETYDWDQQSLMDDTNCLQKDNKIGDGSVFEWLYCEAEAVAHEPDVIATQKRHLIEESSEGVCKKQCNAAAKKQKLKSSTAKDPQSIAAKNRRERISERLKILQELVPNGSKVDLVTMLEKAISYVKFLQVQVKILATDEFWPVQGGKAPDISQVKEAIDAILSSQRERSSSSNSEK